MATNFPSSLDALTNPTGSDTLASPDHAGQHADSNDAIEALQAKVGVDSSAVTSSLDYKVAQKIDKTLVDAKGDLIVASASDTVGRLPVGATAGHVLTVDSTETLGVKWAAAAGADGLIQDFGYDTGDYYGPTITSTTNLTVTEDRTYYIPIYITGTRAFDRIAIRTGSSFSGTATVRLGVYNNSGGIPTTVLFDAGTLSATASTTTYTITINQTINSGWYWLAFNSQTNAATSNFISSTTITYPTMQKYASDGNFAFINVGWFEANVTGTFATAGTLSQTNNMPIVTLRAT